MVGNHVFVENIVSELFFPQIQYLNERVYSEKSFFRKSSILVHWYIFVHFTVFSRNLNNNEIRVIEPGSFDKLHALTDL
jgi:hypothetical protein